MLSSEQKHEYSSMRVEILDLNVLVHFYVRKLNRLGYVLQKTTREFLLEEFIALRYMENGIILHLTNLDDDSGEFSFRNASVAFKKTTKDSKAQKAIHETLKKYRANINRLKVEYRNKRIAHLNYRDDLRFDEYLNFEKILLPLILEANTIADKLWGEEINVKFRLSSQEPPLDFRKNTADLKVDPSKIQGFF